MWDIRERILGDSGSREGAGEEPALEGSNEALKEWECVGDIGENGCAGGAGFLRPEGGVVVLGKVFA